MAVERYGVIAAALAGQWIEQTLSSPQATVTMTIPQTYGRHVEIEVIAKTTRSGGGATDFINVTIDGETTDANNHWQSLTGANGATAATENNNRGFFTVPTADAVSGHWLHGKARLDWFRRTDNAKRLECWTQLYSATNSAAVSVKSGGRIAAAAGAITDENTQLVWSILSGVGNFDTDSVFRFRIVP